MITLREAAQMALEALEHGWIESGDEVVAALRAALEPTDEVKEMREHLAYWQDYARKRDKQLAAMSKLAAEPQEPDGWIDGGGKLQELNPDGFPDWTPLYAAPQADRDALRYRWLRENQCLVSDKGLLGLGERFDAEIDAAMKEAK